jgi:hypothetical protein
MNYPKKDSHFAHRTIRLMHKASVASVIGRDAFCLVTVILHTEDAARYRGPVNFYNSQLMETLGFSKWDSFNRARQRAVDSGWLVYEGDGKRSPGRYFVTIPHGYGMIDDGVIEGIIPESGYNQGYNDGYKAGIIEGIKRGQSGVQTGVTSYPIPNPIPNPIKERSAEPPESSQEKYTDDFLRFWAAFPSLRRKDKRAAWKAWRQAIRRKPAAEIIEAATEYARSETGRGQYVKGPVPWLNADCWDDDRASWFPSRAGQPQTYKRLGD